MKDSAPISLGIIVVAGLFGIIAMGVAMVLYDYQMAGGALIGGIVALVAALVLALGWREPAPGPLGVAAPVAAPAPTAAPAPAAEPTPVAEPEPVTTPEPAAASEPEITAEEAPKVMPSAALPGEAELDAKKGEWKYEGDAAPAEEASAAAQPQFLTAAREGGPDDLKLIKGVGKKLEETLHGMGIYHFDQIAEWGPAEQAWMDDNLKGFKGRATRDNWVEQAKTLAAGGTTEFSDKVKKGDVY
ncbi:NADH:ubiquinone oxidoreductase [Cognatiyoonia sp. IB215182]|uniref:NADH:ubiquinone oxidoreductase n=1 Tax=Cognatiyoonia sp. IB215182 TaxID=3097353 RepID=UPI002A0DB2AA|nr:NADH:ubiquinone oxidoreductase [Cognatiyoonia sp. IB215182]MDX8352332.1 NADH:ubiquinone oxidoreductase [Cognatiyoonia sp. IB215182]